MVKRKSERGQSLVELSISLLILLYLLSGAVEFGLAFFQFVQLRDAAQEGALFGSMSPGPTPGTGTWQSLEQRVRATSSSPIDLADVTKVTVSVYVDNVLVWEDGAAQTPTSVACEGHGVTVRVEYNHQLFMPFIPQLIGRPDLPLNATVTDTILTPRCP
jgi:Flp pilus assembly protein TadG